MFYWWDTITIAAVVVLLSSNAIKTIIICALIPFLGDGILREKKQRICETLLTPIQNCLRFSNNDSDRCDSIPFHSIRFNRKSQFKRTNLLLSKLGVQKNNSQIIRCFFSFSNIKQIMRKYSNISFNFSYDLIDLSYTNNIFRCVFGQTTDRQTKHRINRQCKTMHKYIQLTMCVKAGLFFVVVVVFFRVELLKILYSFFSTRSLSCTLPFFHDEYWICAQ